MPFLFKHIYLAIFAFSFYSIDNEIIVLSDSVSVESSIVGSYCNPRFNFCVSYPELLLPKKEVSDNEDGVILSDVENEFIVTASGSFDVFDWSDEEAYDFILDNFVEDKNDAEIIEVNKSLDRFNLTFSTEDHLFYFQTFIFQDYFVSISIQSPVDKPQSFAELVQKVQLNFDVQYLKSSNSKLNKTKRGGEAAAFSFI